MAVKLTGVQETTVNVGTAAQVHINVEPWPRHARDVMVVIKSDTRFDTWFGHGPFDPAAQIVVAPPPFSLTLNILAKTGTPAGTYVIAIEAVNPNVRTEFLSELNIKVNVKARARTPPPPPPPWPAPRLPGHSGLPGGTAPWESATAGCGAPARKAAAAGLNHVPRICPVGPGSAGTPSWRSDHTLQ